MRRIHIAHSRCKQGFQRGAAPLAHDFGTKSSVLHLSRGVQTSDMQKNHANTLTVQTWDLMLPRSSQVPVTNPDRHLPCHFSKTVLRIPSSWAHPVFLLCFIIFHAQHPVSDTNMGLDQMRRIRASFQFFAQGRHINTQGGNVIFLRTAPYFLRE